MIQRKVPSTAFNYEESDIQTTEGSVDASRRKIINQSQK